MKAAPPSSFALRPSTFGIQPYLRRALCLCVLIALALPAPAKVFWKWGKRDEVVSPDRLGWDRAYETSMKINGSQARVDMLQSDRDLRQTLLQLERVYEAAGGKAVFFRDGASAWGLVTVKGRVIRILVFNLDDRPHPTVMRITQSEGAFKRNRKKADMKRMAHVPPYPGSHLIHTSEDEGTHLALDLSRTADSPESVRAFYTRTLTDQGWTPAMRGAADDFAPAGTLLFRRKGDLCVVSVSASEKTGEQVITLMHKKQQGSNGL